MGFGGAGKEMEGRRACLICRYSCGRTSEGFSLFLWVCFVLVLVFWLTCDIPTRLSAHAISLSTYLWHYIFYLFSCFIFCWFSLAQSSLRG